jgi:hypothetical protein
MTKADAGEGLKGWVGKNLAGKVISGKRTDLRKQAGPGLLVR